MLRRNLYHVLLPLIFIVFVATSCGKSDEPAKPDPPTPPTPETPADKISFTGTHGDGKITFGSDADAAQLTFTASGDWTISVPDGVKEWCSVGPLSGSKGNATVTIQVTKNQAYDQRNASLVIECGKARQTAVVTQKQLDALLLSSSKVEISEEGSTFEIDIETNVDVKFEIPAQYTSWLHASGRADSRGLSKTTYSFKADANDSGETRQGVIRFTGGGLSEEVNVYQISAYSLLLNPKTTYVAAAGGSIAVEIKSNVQFDYTVTKGSDWLHTDKSRAMSSHTVYLTADPYNGVDNDREATVSFKTTEGDKTEELTVIQRCKGSVIVSEHDIEVNAEGGTYDIEYSSNREMRFETPVWISLDGRPSTSRAMQTYLQRVKVNPNISKDERTGTVKIYDSTDPSVADQITIRQKPVEYTVLTSLNKNDFDDARSHDFTIEVKTTLPYTLKPTEGIKSIDAHTFHIDANHTPGTAGGRSVQIEIGGLVVDPVMVYYTQPMTPKITTTDYGLVAAEGDFAIDIETNTDISYSIGSDADWLKLKESKCAAKGRAIDSWTFTALANPTEEQRSGTITFSAGSYWQQAIKITQKGKAIDPGAPVDIKTSTEGGSLQETLGDAAMQVVNLGIDGGVNGKDVATIRHMATEGKLTVLDLGNAEIKKDPANTYYNTPFNPGKLTEDNLVGNWMFYRTNLKEVKLPTTLKKIGYKAFSESKIEEIDIPHGVTDIAESAFSSCRELRRVSVPGTVETITKYAFEQCPKLEKVVLGSGVRKIGRLAFAPNECYTTNTSLRDLELPPTLEEIGYKAFNCCRMAELVIPESVTKIEPWAFAECRYLQRVEFKCAIDTLPERIFYNARNITEIVYPKGLKVIGPHALDEAGLDLLVIPEGVTTLMEGACNSSGIKGVTLPQSLEYIGPQALAGITLTSSITLPSKVTFIGNRAFGMSYITRLHIQCVTPPEHQGDIFSPNFSYSNCTLYVPKGSAAAYSANTYWSKFKEIIEE